MTRWPCWKPFTASCNSLIPLESFPTHLNPFQLTSGVFGPYVSGHRIIPRPLKNQGHQKYDIVLFYLNTYIFSGQFINRIEICHPKQLFQLWFILPSCSERNLKVKFSKLNSRNTIIGRVCFFILCLFKSGPSSFLQLTWEQRCFFFFTILLFFMEWK